jgi:hypothetical protein
MAHFARWSALLVLTLAGFCSGLAGEAMAAEGEREHGRAEAAVNRYTTPSIESLFEQLTALQPLSFDRLWRNLPDRPPQERSRLALLTGAVIADGFLVVAAERPSRVESVGRSLLRFAKALGIGERLNRRSRHLIEQAQAEHWQEVRRELVHTQSEAELAMVALRDEEMVHLVALGGWLRGLEITSSAVADDYTPERSRLLIQPELAQYFLDHVARLRPRTHNSALIQLIEKDLHEVDGLVDEGKGRKRMEKLGAGEVKRLRDLAKEMDDAIAAE